MRTALCTLRSVSLYTQSRQHHAPKLDKETHDAYERRTWIEKGHYTKDGSVFIPPLALKFGIAAAARMFPVKIVGKGQKTYTKHFEAGILVTDGPVLSIKKEQIEPTWIPAHADGRRGSGKRVDRAFPTIPEWTAVATFYVLDHTITPELFEETLRNVGRFIGIGQFRPENGGINGRFEVEKVEWK